MLAAGVPAAAKEVDGRAVPDTVTAEGKTLKLNGPGLRTKCIFKVYVGALYLEKPTYDAAQSSSSPTQVRAWT